MIKSGLFVKVVIFAAYLLAMLAPGLTMGGAQTLGEHDRMMAMATHDMTTTMGMGMGMGDTGSPATDQTMPLCQQHCLVVVAILPEADQTSEIAGHPVAVVTKDDPLVSSLAFPPPGHPPKVAGI